MATSEEKRLSEASDTPARDEDLPSKHTADEESLLESGITFTPRVSQQRYDFVREIIRDFKSKKVIDMGCGECQLVIRLKREMCIEQLAGVDVNRNFLEASKHLIQPLLYEYIHGREAPLTATLYQGSIAERDSRLVGWDLLACVEVIEHLEDDNLQKMPAVIFGYMRPAVAVFTTPNADFNVLFEMGERRFRHWDHKFEWSRQEFQEWGDKICHKYGYKVRYTGVASGPEGTEHLGLCSQIAVFERLAEDHDSEEQEDHNKMDLLPYNVVQHSVYPYKPDRTTLEDKILLEAEYYAHKLAIDASREHSDTEEEGEKDDDLDIVDGQFDDAEDDEDEVVAFGGHLSMRRGEDGFSRTFDKKCVVRTRLCESEDGSVTAAIPLCKLMAFNGLQKLCPSVDILRSVLRSSSMVKLSSDETEVLCPVADEADTKYSLLSEFDDLDYAQEAGKAIIDDQQFAHDDIETESWD